LTLSIISIYRQHQQRGFTPQSSGEDKTMTTRGVFQAASNWAATAAAVNDPSWHVDASIIRLG
jgi:hypothetical protein